jgi:hypothetical protein
MDRYVNLFKQSALDSGMEPAKAERFAMAINGFRNACVNS